MPVRHHRRKTPVTILAVSIGLALQLGAAAHAQEAAQTTESGQTTPAEGTVDTLDTVSARLSSEALRFLNWRVTFGGRRARAEARGWLEREGLVTR